MKKTKTIPEALGGLRDAIDGLSFWRLFVLLMIVLTPVKLVQEVIMGLIA